VPLEFGSIVSNRNGMIAIDTGIGRCALKCAVCVVGLSVGAACLAAEDSRGVITAILLAGIPALWLVPQLPLHSRVRLTGRPWL
jgi:hypothetical protein